MNGQSLTGTLTWNANGSLQELVISDPFTSANNQTCTYAYDDLSRLGSVNCGSAWSQTFSSAPEAAASTVGKPAKRRRPKTASSPINASCSPQPDCLRSRHTPNAPVEVGIAAARAGHPGNLAAQRPDCARVNQSAACACSRQPSSAAAHSASIHDG